MKLTNADRAVIAPDKLTAYLLNVAHRRGGPKAKLLIRKEEGWSVEFFDMTGRTVALVTAPASLFRPPPTPADRPAIRTLTPAGA